MLSLGRPLLHGGSSGGVATAPCASGPKRPFLAANSTSPAPNVCPLRTGSPRLYDGSSWLPRSAAGANSSSAVESNASTVAGTAMLTAQGLVSSYNGSGRPTHILDLPGSAASAARGQEEPLLGWDHADQPLAHTLDGAALRVAGTAAASSPSHAVSSPPARSRHDGAPASPTEQHQPQDPDVSLEPAAGAAAAAPPRSAGSGRTLGLEPVVSASLDSDDAQRPLPTDGDAQPVPSTSAPAGHTGSRRGRAGGSNLGSSASSSSSRTSNSALAGAADERGHTARSAGSSSSSTLQPRYSVSRSSAIAAAPALLPPAPLRPRLKPAPPPQSWPDYPYARRPAASACATSDEAGLKLEALFQSVLHYPRVPPKLLRFLRRAVPGGVEAQLPALTASVEGLSTVLGREVAVYLIRRRPWVVTVPAECLGPRMEAVRHLLGLAPSGVLDVLRKNPNLLRMERATLRQRYEALHESTGFSADQVRALVLKYPLIVNFHPDSVESAAVALRRLCSARASWAAHHSQLSPSQFAFYMRDRVHTLLRLEYLLITGGGGSWTLRDIIKTSNNTFKRSQNGFRSWMTDRLRRLRERLHRARAAAAAEGRLSSVEAMEEVDEEAESDYEEDEQRRFVQELGQRRAAERSDMERREEQRRVAVEAKMRLQAQAEAQRTEDDEEDEAEAGQRGRWRGGAEWAGDGEVDGELEQQQRQQMQQRQRGGPPMTGGARPPAWQSWPGQGPARAAGGRGPSHPPPPPNGDLLATVSPGRIWNRPGSRIPQPQQQQQHHVNYSQDSHVRQPGPNQQQQQRWEQQEHWARRQEQQRGGRDSDSEEEEEEDRPGPSRSSFGRSQRG